MDLSTLNVDFSTPALAITLWVASGIGFVATAILYVLHQMKKFTLPGLGAEGVLILISTFSAAAIPFGAIAEASARADADNVSFQKILEVDYGMTTQSSLYDIEEAAETGRLVVMSDETGSFDVRPNLNGEILTFSKIDEGAPINPRT